MRPLLSIITGTYNRLPLLQDLFQSVRQDIPDGINYEFVICDGGSTDGTIEWLKAQPGTTLIEHGALLGAITAFTDAGKLARGKYTLILNDDVSVLPGSIMRAIVYLEENPRAGMVAFLDNRPSPHHAPGSFHTLQHMATKDGGDVTVVYGQCCMVRTWLGQHVHWWRGYPEQGFAARTYAGDNLLSSNIWALGYTVDSVDGCRVHDTVVNDGLRSFNNTEGRDQEDSAEYYRVMPTGAALLEAPSLPQLDKRQLRVLYLPLYEPGFGHYKRGLRDALAKHYIVYEHDYRASGRNVTGDLITICQVFQPDMILSQIHDVDTITNDTLMTLRANFPRVVIVNWNGDYWPQNLTSLPMLDLLRNVDLQLVINADALPTYEQRGIPAAYWQIGYEPTHYDDLPLPEDMRHDVVFLATAYTQQRHDFGRFLKTLPYNVGIYGSGWPDSDGDTLYNFDAGAMLYRGAKIAIGDNQFTDTYGFVSNRLFQALAAGGALLLHQKVRGLQELTGITAGEHYIEWESLEDLEHLIAFWTAPENDTERRSMAQAAATYARKHHSFDARVRELFGDKGHIQRSRRTPNRYVPLMFLGGLQSGGYVGPVTRTQYSFIREGVLMVDQLDVDQMVASGYWKRV